MAKLRLSLTIPGAVSLGAYEGGALAALILAAKALGEDTLVIDTIAAASAGSITGLLTARSLLRDVDPVKLLSEAWVANVSFQAMRCTTTESPLSSTALNDMANAVLGPQGVPDGPQANWQVQPIRLSMALASLAGLNYVLADLEQDHVPRHLRRHPGQDCRLVSLPRPRRGVHRLGLQRHRLSAQAARPIGGPGQV
jgi:hypothetical protein